MQEFTQRQLQTNKHNVKQKKKRVLYGSIFLIISILCLIRLLYVFQLIPHAKYDNKHFGIETYKSSIDNDNDGIDDQTDILQGVRDYIATKPKYKSVYYAGGYSNDEYGVCTDVVAHGLRTAGYDLMYLVDEHIKANLMDYEIEKPDKNIDFRRVRNLYVYFKATAIELTTDIYQIEEWQGGDIIVFKKHIGIVSDKRNAKGVPFIIHHGSSAQKGYEQDILEYRDDIIGHFRVS
ncbi:MAG: DUF1287 domain-containing protein [Lachnospiraceae bacterium]|nr:DUF1287 domain-containing protein [Lachnospiraceae bacterium]